uniref:Uncharacterized protein n=1 Tax=Haemonchus contortus TaxID=6289 RepID=A0A7I4Y1V3_HAECO
MCFIFLETWPTHPTLDPVSPGRSKGANEFRDRHTDRQTDGQTDRQTKRFIALVPPLSEEEKAETVLHEEKDWAFAPQTMQTMQIVVMLLDNGPSRLFRKQLIVTDISA